MSWSACDQILCSQIFCFSANTSSDSAPLRSTQGPLYLHSSKSTAGTPHQQIYFEALDLAVTSTTDRFDQPGFRIYPNIEQLLFKACTGEDYDRELSFVCEFYGQDLNKVDLESQLKALQTMYFEGTEKGERPSIKMLKKVPQRLSPAQRTLVNMVFRAVQLLLMPATNSTSERSFCGLRRIETYLRSTMSQLRLNHLMKIKLTA